LTATASLQMGKMGNVRQMLRKTEAVGF